LILFNPLDILNDVIEEVSKNIHKYCKNPGKDFTRARKLPVQRLIKLILEMHDNSIKTELSNSFPVLDERMTASAFIQQRNKLKAEVFKVILKILRQYLDYSKKFKDCNVYAIDGTDLYYPENPKSECYIKPDWTRKDGTDVKGYCLLHANILYDVLNKQYIDCIAGPKYGFGGNERAAATEFIDTYGGKKKIFIMDRGYISYNMIEHGNRCGGYYMIRSLVHQGAFKEIDELLDEPIDKWINLKFTISGKKEYKEQGYKYYQIIKEHTRKNTSELSEFSEKAGKRQWDFEEACEIRFRIVKFRINDYGKDQWEVIITNLPSNIFSTEDIKHLYAMRWGIETSFRSLKYAVGAIQFHSKQDEFVLQELYADLIMYNVTSACGESVDLPVSNTKHEYKINFKEAVSVVRKYFREKIESFTQLCAEIAFNKEAVRRGRKDKRKVRQKAPVYFVYRVA
jgi:hypothetical protein